MKVKQLILILKKIPSITKEKADELIAKMGITADKFESTLPIEDKLNNIVSKADQYKKHR